MILESDIAASRSIGEQHFFLSQGSGSFAGENSGESVSIGRVGHVTNDEGAIACRGSFITIGEGELQASDFFLECRKDSIQRCAAARLEEQAVAGNGIAAIGRNEHLGIVGGGIATIQELPAHRQFVVGIVSGGRCAC